MSSNVVSQPLSTSHQQMDSNTDQLDVLIPNMQLGMMGGVVNSPSAQQFAVSNMQMGLVDPVANDFGRQFLMANHRVGNRVAATNDMDSQKMFIPSKRSADGELKFSSDANQNSVPAQTLSSKTGFNQQSSASKRTSQVNPKPSAPVASNKKMVRNDSGKSKQAQTSKNRVTTQVEPSPKAESSESMRTKMRESLSSALSMVAEKKEKAPTNDNIPKKEVSPQQLGDSQQNSVQVDSASATVGGDSPHRSLCKETCSADKAIERNVDSSQEETKGVEQGVHCGTFPPNEDVAFGESTFIKDDLLQGNGLSWAMDLDVEVEEPKDVQVAQKTELVNEAAGGETEHEAKSSERLAFEIEAELFKLFGGVNKKYKEKGRSLLFNLKDRSNPELRERVMSGDIPPQRLCSMTPEELASKELSEWRIAKAEELAQMKVLPDSDVDIRRLVKKTHKGDIQVEVEQDDGVSVEVSIGTSSLPPLLPVKKNTKVHIPSVGEEPRDKEGSEISLTIPNDGTDFMQGLMVDEFKDAGHLPPIVSLDEFMESLDSEPPFQNLHEENENMASPTDTKIPDGGDEGKLSGATPEELAKPHHGLEAKLKDSNVTKSYRVDVKMEESDLKLKPRESPTALKPSPRGVLSSKADHLWEGLLQLNISAAVTAVGFFRSGEPTSTKEWPQCIEIKGRVRMDAFEKFVQGLPMSRSRAVMVTHFVLKEGSTEMDNANLYEASQSLLLDDRLGFAEPVPGVEIYFCPPQSRAVEMMRTYFPKNQTEVFSSIENGLIGMVVWRRPHISSTISPNSSSHHKHGSKKPHFSSRHQERETNMNLNYNQSSVPMKAAQTQADDDDDDDIPPGFGPKPAREDDDLPEFNFSGAPTQPVIHPRSQPLAPSPRPTKPVEQIRELILKYGKPGNDSGAAGAHIGVKSWKYDEDDDDIPEWQPQAPTQPLSHNFQQPMLRPHVSHHLPQQHSGATPYDVGHLQLDTAAHGTRWAQPPVQRGGHQAVPVLRAGQGGQRRRQDSTSRRRGF